VIAIRCASTRRFAPVHYSRLIYEAARHWDIARAERTDLIGRVDLLVAQQVRSDTVGCMLAALIGLAIQRLDAHALHQGADVPAPNLDAFAT
jgi:hypothetical protein